MVTVVALFAANEKGGAKTNSSMGFITKFPTCLLLLAAVLANLVEAQTWYVPPPQTTFYWQLSDANPNVEGSVDMSSSARVYGIDGFTVAASTIANLKARGKKVVCYFSFGSVEDFRPDYASFPTSVQGSKVCAEENDAGGCISYWPGERWLDVRSPVVKSIMEKRIRLAKGKGCDGIDPDNVDGYANKVNAPAGKPLAKFNITVNDQLAFNKWIAATCHKYNMGVGLKNANAIGPQLAALFDWALNEECNAYTDWSTGAWYPGKYECDYALTFIRLNKAVFVMEYDDFWGDNSNWQGSGITFPQGVCQDNNAHGFSTKEFNRDVSQQQFPAANCLNHVKLATCNSCWKTCILPVNYGRFKRGKGAQIHDQIGACVRNCAKLNCKYV